MNQRLIAVVIIAVLTLAAVIASEHSPPNAGLPIVNADYQRCIRINPGPLRSEPHIDGDNRHREIA